MAAGPMDVDRMDGSSAHGARDARRPAGGPWDRCAPDNEMQRSDKTIRKCTAVVEDNRLDREAMRCHPRSSSKIARARKRGRAQF
jgi:hypothetical protein